MMSAPESKPTSSSASEGGALPLLRRVCGLAGASGQFGKVEVVGARLACAAANADAEYRVDVQEGVLCVSLVTADRYLSQSIEQDFVHTGDKMADLLHDELIDVEYSGPALGVEHYRSPEKLFTFRTKVLIAPHEWGQEQTVEQVWKVLRAYEACFTPLGGMSGEKDD